MAPWAYFCSAACTEASSALFWAPASLFLDCPADGTRFCSERWWVSCWALKGCMPRWHNSLTIYLTRNWTKCAVSWRSFSHLFFYISPLYVQTSHLSSSPQQNLPYIILYPPVNSKQQVIFPTAAHGYDRAWCSTFVFWIILCKSYKHNRFLGSYRPLKPKNLTWIQEVRNWKKNMQLYE